MGSPYRKAMWRRDCNSFNFSNESYAAGWLFGCGCVLPYNTKQAAEFYERAVSQGHLEAHVTLGACYFLGRGVDKNEAKAVELYRAAADKGESEAIHALALKASSGNARAPQQSAQDVAVSYPNPPTC